MNPGVLTTFLLLAGDRRWTASWWGDWRLWVSAGCHSDRLLWGNPRGDRGSPLLSFEQVRSVSQQEQSGPQNQYRYKLNHASFTHRLLALYRPKFLFFDAFYGLFFTWFYCSDPSWGGRNYILKRFFFVQSILADRYIHRRELRQVSLESLSRVEYGIKKIFNIRPHFLSRLLLRSYFTSSNFFSLYHFAAFSTFCVKSFWLL